MFELQYAYHVINTRNVLLIIAVCGLNLSNTSSKGAECNENHTILTFL